MRRFHPQQEPTVLQLHLLFVLTAVRQDVSLQAALVRRDVAALGAAVDLLLGV